MSLARYLRSLEEKLPGQTGEYQEVMEELRAHLEECAHDLQLQGLPSQASEEEALRRFGPSQDIARCLSTPPRRQRWGAVRGLIAVLTLSMGGTIGAGMAAALGMGHSTVPPKVLLRQTLETPRHTPFVVHISPDDLTTQR